MFDHRIAVRLSSIIAVSAGLAMASGPAHAALPPEVRAMVDAAAQTNDPEIVATVIAIARQINPDDGAELDSLADGFRQRHEEYLAQQEAEEKAAIRKAAFFRRWTGRGEIGATRATGNADDAGATIGLALKREGIDWTHKLKLRFEYQRSDGDTTREYLMGGYEPRFRLHDRLYSYGLVQYERDRFQGYLSRVALSGGLGYHVIRRDDMNLTLDAGPAWRTTDFVADGRDSRFAARASMDFDWSVSDVLALTQEASAIIESDNRSFTSATGLEAGIGANLKARLSYSVEHDTDPPVGARSTDTMSRFTLIYGF